MRHAYLLHLVAIILPLIMLLSGGDVAAAGRDSTAQDNTTSAYLQRAGHMVEWVPVDYRYQKRDPNEKTMELPWKTFPDDSPVYKKAFQLHPVLVLDDRLGRCLDELDRAGVLRTVYVRTVLDEQGNLVSIGVVDNTANDPATNAFATATVQGERPLVPNGKGSSEHIIAVDVFVGFPTQE